MSDNNIVTDKELQNDERISAYLRGEMTADEEAAFKKELETDEELRSQANAVAHLAKAMRQVGEKQDEDIKEALLSSDEESVRKIAAEVTHKAKVIPLRRRLVKVVSLAACVLLLVGVGFQYYNFRAVTGLGDTYGSAFVSEQPLSRGAENETVAKELTSLYANVQNGKDLDATIKRLSVLWELSTMDTFNDYTNDAPYIGWNLAVANLKNDDKDAAKEVLTKLISKTEDGSSVNVKAKELLEKLK